MRSLVLAAFPLVLPFPAWPYFGTSRPDSSHAFCPFDDHTCEHLPPEGF